MNMRSSIMQIYNLLKNDEELMRLLYYVPTKTYDFADENDINHPYNPSKDDITTKSIEDRWEITNNLIKTTTTQNELDSKTKNRICIYAGARPNNNSVKGSYLTSEQTVIVDIFTPILYDELDMRLPWITDKVNDILFKKTLENVGISDLLYKNGNRVNAPEGYNAYALIYKFQDFN